MDLNGTEDEAEKNDQVLQRRKDVNIAVLAIAMFLVFTGYFTMAATGETIIRAYSDRTGEEVNG